MKKKNKFQTFTKLKSSTKNYLNKKKALTKQDLTDFQTFRAMTCILTSCRIFWIERRSRETSYDQIKNKMKIEENAVLNGRLNRRIRKRRETK